MKKDLALVARRLAASGMVLLKNEDSALPLNDSDTVALIGNGCFDYTKGGLGSASVTSEYTVDIIEGLRLRGASVNADSLTRAECYDLESCNRYAEGCDCAIVSIARNSGEGTDCELDWFDLSAEETALFDALEESSFKKVIVILNVAGVIDIASIAKYEKVKAILMAWLPGMEGGNAICDVLYGDVTPSGRLTDTIAYKYSDYPSASTFNASPTEVNYAEDIFVGYRYFESFAKERVAYPFGFGLSYTSFEYSNVGFSECGGKISVSVTVKNVGDRPGAEAVQVYSSSPKTDIPKAKIELRAYKKTSILSPGAQETVTVSFNSDDMAYFDEAQAAFILEGGDYTVWVGKNVRDVKICGIYTQSESKTVWQTSLKFSHGMPYKMDKHGKICQTHVWDAFKNRSPISVISSGYDKNKICSTVRENNRGAEKEDTAISLYDVASGKTELKEFIKKMTSDRLIDMAMGQPPALIRGTAGIGNLPCLGIPNAQTGDGPAGVRSTRPTICFPCATLLACTWDEGLLEEVGKALGEDAIKNNLDILLAPGLNVHRNPLAGRNFEYYSEDPIISGKSAAAIVRGVQSMGIGATLKHFALNNKEENRKDSNSIATERAIREIYLKGFGIAIKESDPWCVMTSYNIINGERAATCAGLLKGILREEWGYLGLIMTDWRVKSHLWEEIKAGSNVKMPCGYPEEIELARSFYDINVLTREELEDCAEYILRTVMKTRRFKEKNFGVTQSTESFNLLEFSCLSTTWSGTHIESDGTTSLAFVGLDRRFMDVFVDYRIESREAADYVMKINAACMHDGQWVEISVNGESVATAKLAAPECGGEKFFDFESTPFALPIGISELRLTFRGAKVYDSAHYKKISFLKLS